MENSLQLKTKKENDPDDPEDKQFIQKWTKKVTLESKNKTKNIWIENLRYIIDKIRTLVGPQKAGLLRKSQTRLYLHISYNLIGVNTPYKFYRWIKFINDDLKDFTYEQKLGEKDQELAENNKQLAENNKQLAEKDQELAENNHLIIKIYSRLVDDQNALIKIYENDPSKNDELEDHKRERDRYQKELEKLSSKNPEAKTKNIVFSEEGKMDEKCLEDLEKMEAGIMEGKPENAVENKEFTGKAIEALKNKFKKNEPIMNIPEESNKSNENEEKKSFNDEKKSCNEKKQTQNYLKVAEETIKKFIIEAKKFLMSNQMIRKLFFDLLLIERPVNSELDLETKINEILIKLANQLEERLFFVRTPHDMSGYTSKEFGNIFLKYDFDFYDPNFLENFLLAGYILSFLHELFHYLRSELYWTNVIKQIDTPEISIKETEIIGNIHKFLQENNLNLAFQGNEAGNRVELLLFGEKLKKIYRSETKTLHEFLTMENDDYDRFRSDFIKHREEIKKNEKNMKKKETYMSCRAQSDGDSDGLQIGKCFFEILRS